MRGAAGSPLAESVFLRSVVEFDQTILIPGSDSYCKATFSASWRDPGEQRGDASVKKRPIVMENRDGVEGDDRVEGAFVAVECNDASNSRDNGVSGRCFICRIYPRPDSGSRDAKAKLARAGEGGKSRKGKGRDAPKPAVRIDKCESWSHVPSVTIAAALLSLKDNATELLLRFTIAARSLRRRRHRRGSPRSHARIDPRANRLPSGRRVPTKSTRVIKSTQRLGHRSHTRIKRERRSSWLSRKLAKRKSETTALRALLARCYRAPAIAIRFPIKTYVSSITSITRRAASGSSWLLAY